MGGGPPREYLIFTLPQAEPKQAIIALRKKFPYYDIKYYQVGKEKLDATIWRDVTIVCTLSTLPEDPKADAPNLKLVQLISAGSNQLQDKPVYTDTEIPITTSSGIHGPQIAEWAVMTALVASHKYNQLYELQKQHRWGSEPGRADQDYQKVHDKVGRRLGVLGYGSIGGQVGRVAKAMGMEVVAFTATPKDTPEKKRDNGFIVPGTGDVEGAIPSEWYSGLEKKNLHKFLAQKLDWLLVSVPLTSQTRHFLSTEEFRILSDEGRRPAFVTNIARGPIIDQPALIEALKDGTLGGAALDVTEPEPLPEDNELWTLPNAIVTPHVSGVGSSYFERALDLFSQNLERMEKGEPLLNVVRRERGY